MRKSDAARTGTYTGRDGIAGAAGRARSRPHREAGVTLVELAAVMALLVILGFASVLALGNVREITRTKGAAEQVASAIHQTRSYAVMHSAVYEITFPAGDQITIACTGNCDDSPPGDGPTPVIHDLIVTPPGSDIWFDSTGASNGGSVVVNPGPDQKTVSVTLAGRVQITPP